MLSQANSCHCKTEIRRSRFTSDNGVIVSIWTTLFITLNPRWYRSGILRAGRLQVLRPSRTLAYTREKSPFEITALWFRWTLNPVEPDCAVTNREWHRGSFFFFHLKIGVLKKSKTKIRFEGSFVLMKKFIMKLLSEMKINGRRRGVAIHSASISSVVEKSSRYSHFAELSNWLYYWGVSNARSEKKS